MEIHQLKAFVAVANTGSFTRAAATCHVAQSALSKSIQKLEGELGTKLFHRLERRTAVTAEGHMLLSTARRILNDIDGFKQRLAEGAGQWRGIVSVGALPTISPYLLPQVITQFTQRCPEFQVVADEEVTATLLKMIESHELDLGLATLPIPDRVFACETLFKEELLLAVPSEHHLAGQAKISIQDLERERFILMKQEHCLADQVLSFCHTHDLPLQVVFNASQIETVQSLVMAGVGISLMPQMARLGGKLPLVYRSLEAPKPTRTVVVVWRKAREHTRAAQEFLRQLRQVTKAFAATLQK